MPVTAGKEQGPGTRVNQPTSALQQGHAGAVSQTEPALIGAGAALVGVIIAFADNAWLDRARDRRAGKRARDAAIGELLAATADLMSGISTVRAAYAHQRPWRHYLRTSAVTFAALCSMFAAAGEVSWSALTDWRQPPQLLDRLLAEDLRLDERQRTIALDLGTVLVPRTIRFYAAVAVLTLGPDEKITNAVRSLTPAVGALLEAVAARDRRYELARRRTERALGEFRGAADQRR
jgi:hypothetical protein